MQGQFAEQLQLRVCGAGGRCSRKSMRRVSAQATSGHPGFPEQVRCAKSPPWHSVQSQKKEALGAGLHGHHHQLRLPSPQFPVWGSSPKEGDGKPPCRGTSPSALRCPNSSTVEHEELHCRNTDEVGFSSQNGKPGANARSFHGLVSGVFLL